MSPAGCLGVLSENQARRVLLFCTAGSRRSHRPDTDRASVVIETTGHA